MAQKKVLICRVYLIMENNWLRVGYVMVSRALLMSMCEKQGAANGDEEAFLRVLTHVNYKTKVAWCNGVEVTCARGESVISFMGWADILGWRRGHVRRFFERCIAQGLVEKVPGDCLSHIRIPGYDAWTGNSGEKKKVEKKVDEIFERFIDKYGEVTHIRIESKALVGKLWKKLSTRERELALERIEDYYYSLSDIRYCRSAAKYLDLKIFNEDFTN